MESFYFSLKDWCQINSDICWASSGRQKPKRQCSQSWLVADKLEISLHCCIASDCPTRWCSSLIAWNSDQRKVPICSKACANLRLLLTVGIGKSLFSFYLMWRLARLGGQTIIWERRDAAKKRVMFSPQGVFAGSEDSFDTELEDEKTWWAQLTLA